MSAERGEFGISVSFSNKFIEMYSCYWYGALLLYLQTLVMVAGEGGGRHREQQ